MARRAKCIREVATLVRLATPADATAIAAIFAEGIGSGTATVVSRPATAEAIRQRVVAAAAVPDAC